MFQVKILLTLILCFELSQTWGQTSQYKRSEDPSPSNDQSIITYLFTMSDQARDCGATSGIVDVTINPGKKNEETGQYQFKIKSCSKKVGKWSLKHPEMVCKRYKLVSGSDVLKRSGVRDIRRLKRRKSIMTIPFVSEYSYYQLNVWTKKGQKVIYDAHRL